MFLEFYAAVCLEIEKLFYLCSMKQILLLLAILFPILGSAQDKVPFNGIVKDVFGKPVRNVRVHVDNPRLYATTDKQGRFGLTDVKPTDVLHVKVKKKEYEIPVEGKKSIVIIVAEDFLLKEAVESQELVDIGYGFVKRREHTLPGNTISGEELVRTGRSDILSALQGKVPGLNISTNNRPGGESSVNIRGIQSINLPSTPLYIVDGIEQSSLMHISVYDVDYVEVMKDASIYGSRGANGAIIVHTKR